MSTRNLVQLALVLIVLWAKTHSALQIGTVTRDVQFERKQPFVDQQRDEISIPSDEEQLARELMKSRKHIGAKNTAPSRVHHSYPRSPRNLHEEIRPLPKRSKRKIFGFDDRLYIPRSYTQLFPFRTTVKISTGCTGTLVSPRHVLTSAHCLHSGTAFVPGFNNLSVGFLQRNASVRWAPVSHTHISRNWTSGQDTYASKFDFAILKLSKRHNHGFMPITLSEGRIYGSGQKIHFSAFEDDKPANTMWYRNCFVRNATRNMLFHCCDAKRGSSGSGVYIYFFDNKTRSRVRKVIGVFSGNRNVYNRPDWSRCPYSRYSRYRDPLNGINYNAAIRINSANFRQMCRWMDKDGGEDCRRVMLEEKRRRRRRRRNRRRRGHGRAANKPGRKPAN